MKRRIVVSHLLVVCVGVALLACGSDPSPQETSVEPRPGQGTSAETGPKEQGSRADTTPKEQESGADTTPKEQESGAETVPKEQFRWMPVCLFEQTCNGRCVDESNDPSNCGACGRSCGTGACVDGQCCYPGWASCGNKCTEIETDPDNCGACGNVCPNGQCASATCCPEGFMNCGSDVCTNVKSSYTDCGSCGHTCGLGQSCQNGVCTCPPGAHFCG